MGELENTGASFELTSWTLIDALRGGNDDERRRVMERLVRLYWPPVYAFIRKSGKGRDAAAEITQGFFATKVIEKGLFERADRERGRLRTLLLRSVQYYVCDVERKGRTQRDGAVAGLNGFHRGVVEEEAALVEMLAEGEAGSPEEAFELRWARGLFEEAMARCERHCRDSGLERHWGVAEEWFIRPALRGAARPSTEDLARRWGFKGPRLVSAAVQLVKRHWELRLREVVAETVGRGGLDDAAYWAAVNEEYDRVVAVLAGGN